MNAFVEEGQKKTTLCFGLLNQLTREGYVVVTKACRSTRYVGDDDDDRNNNNSKKPGRSDIFEP
jgi:hypothetical protein